MIEIYYYILIMANSGRRDLSDPTMALILGLDKNVESTQTNMNLVLHSRP